MVEQHRFWVISRVWWVVSRGATGSAKRQWETSESVCQCLTCIWLWPLNIFINLFLDVQCGVTTVFNGVCQNKDNPLTVCLSTSFCRLPWFHRFINTDCCVNFSNHKGFTYALCQVLTCNMLCNMLSTIAILNKGHTTRKRNAQIPSIPFFYTT